MPSTFFSQPGWTYGTFNSNKYRYFTHAPVFSKPTFLLLHGFPFGPLAFRSLLPLLQSRGYGIIMPELIGYGETEKDTTNLEKFERKSIADDLATVLDKERVDKVVVFGHDHGANVAAAFSRFYPGRSRALVLVSVSYLPPSPTGLDLDIVRRMLEPVLGYENFGYWKTFLAPHASQLIGDHLESFISIMYAKDYDLWLTRFCPTGTLEKALLQDFQTESLEFASPEVKAELRTYVEETGLLGPLAWYHAAVSPTLNHASERSAPKRITVPYLFLATNKDKACPPVAGAEQGKWCDDLTVKEFDEGHWVCEADPEGVVKAVEEWMGTKRL